MHKNINQQINNNIHRTFLVELKLNLHSVHYYHMFEL